MFFEPVQTRIIKRSFCVLAIVLRVCCWYNTIPISHSSNSTPNQSRWSYNVVSQGALFSVKRNYTQDFYCACRRKGTIPVWLTDSGGLFDRRRVALFLIVCVHNGSSIFQGASCPSPTVRLWNCDGDAGIRTHRGRGLTDRLVFSVLERDVCRSGDGGSLSCDHLFFGGACRERGQGAIRG